MGPRILIAGQTRDGREYVVRPYRRLDRARVRYICCETGFLGDPQEAVFAGRELFADLWSGYWTDYEPESAFVAEVEGRVEGYVLGCLDTRRQLRIWERRIVPVVGVKMLATGWWRWAINRHFIRAMRRSARQGELDWPMREILARYPAHLHTNIADPALRGQGLGGAMMKAHFQYLHQHGITGVHLGTTSHNRRAVPFYYHLGFQLLHQAHATIRGSNATFTVLTSNVGYGVP